ncbi:sugar phosphate isomerase/epimerase family protein [Arthrobacter sp. 2MCAF14]|uniref:sugar phosphate isomerase/epimerase family protein n=1 Tax=Arthrobacter sp. 2MCAF14 TaxID=3232982 RepID=UPI003F924F53
MELCCSSPMVPGATITEKARHLRAWGYDAIAVFQPFADWNEETKAELVSLEERTGIRPAEFVLIDDVYGNAMSSDPELRERCRAMYRQAAEVCAQIGAVTEIEFQYGPQNPMPLFDPYQQLSTEQEGAFVAFYREMLDIVAGTQGRVLLEPLNRYESRYLNLISDNARIVDAVAHPNAGLLPDTFHMSIEEERMGDALRHAGDRIVHVHLGDSNRLLPGQGILDWSEIFAALQEVGYKGYVNLECSTSGDPANTLPATARFLHQLMG